MCGRIRLPADYSRRRVVLPDPELGQAFTPTRRAVGLRETVLAEPAWQIQYGHLSAGQQREHFADFWGSLPRSQQLRGLRYHNRAQAISSATMLWLDGFVPYREARAGNLETAAAYLGRDHHDERISMNATSAEKRRWLLGQPSRALAYLVDGGQREVLDRSILLRAPFVRTIEEIELELVSVLTLQERLERSAVWHETPDDGRRIVLGYLHEQRNRPDTAVLHDLVGPAFDAGLADWIDLTRDAPDAAERCRRRLLRDEHRPSGFPRYPNGDPQIDPWLNALPLSAVAHLASLENGNFVPAASAVLARYTPDMVASVEVAEAPVDVAVALGTSRYRQTGETYAVYMSKQFPKLVAGLSVPIRKRIAELQAEIAFYHGNSDWMRDQQVDLLTARSQHYSIHGLPQWHRVLYWVHPSERRLHLLWAGTHERYTGVTSMAQASVLAGWARTRMQTPHSDTRQELAAAPNDTVLSP